MKPPRFAPFAAPIPRTAVMPEGAADPPAEDDVPPIEQFLDEFPSIDDYLAADEIEEQLPVAVGTPEPAAGVDDADGWVGGQWQSYDWQGIVALATPPAARPAIQAELPDSAWPNPESFTTQPLGDTLSVTSAGASSAEEVARALDDIARRIRSGEMNIDQFRSSPPEAAMAAALAAMLRLRG
jgi:hypothetical protein